MKRLTILLAAAATLAAVPALARNEVVRQIPVSDSFFEGEVRWAGIPGGYEYLWTVRDVDGIVEVCGVGVYTSATVRRGSRAVMRDAWVELNGQKILSDLTFFSRVSFRDDLKGAEANCVATGVARPGGKAEVGIHYRKTGYRN